MAKERVKVGIDNLKDVTVASVAHGDELAYDAASSAFKNRQKAPVNTQTADYVLVLADSGKTVELNKATAISVTVPPNASVAFPIGTVIDVVQLGAGAATVVAGAAVTIRSAAGALGIAAQYAGARLRKRATNEWVLTGSLA